MWTYSIWVHLDHELCDACTRSLADRVVVCLGLHDVVRHHLRGKLGSPHAAIISHHQPPCLLRVEPDPLGEIVAIEAHAGQQYGELLFSDTGAQGLHEGSCAHRRRKPDLAPVVTQPVSQLLCELRGHGDKQVPRQCMHHGLAHKVANLADETIGVEQATVNEVSEGTCKKRTKVLATALHDLLQRPVRGLQALPALCHVPSLPLARRVNLVHTLHQLAHEALRITVVAAVAAAPFRLHRRVRVAVEVPLNAAQDHVRHLFVKCCTPLAGHEPEAVAYCLAHADLRVL
mmetsp:Transcript_26125/g.65694  ORF Transcript_26125/g.65694 Transcript_26125/m.65694 type:complete len:288 (+) Transcript_26125:1395-2258(+)